MEGWIRLSRKIQEHWIWKDPVKLKWWIDILVTVNHSDTKVNIGMELYECKRGQSVMSLSNWAKRWGASKDSTRNFLNLLQKDGMILHENLVKTTRITVCNYDSYQTDLHDRQTTSKRKPNASRTTAERNTDTNNNDKNDKNDKEISPKRKVENNSNNIFSFEDFWEAYNKKVEKKKCQNKFESISNSDKQIISEHVKKYVASTPDVQFRKNPLTYLNGECWHDEIITKQNTQLSITQFSGKYEEF